MAARQPKAGFFRTPTRTARAAPTSPCCAVRTARWPDSLSPRGLNGSTTRRSRATPSCSRWRLSWKRKPAAPPIEARWLRCSSTAFASTCRCKQTRHLRPGRVFRWQPAPSRSSSRHAVQHLHAQWIAAHTDRDAGQGFLAGGCPSGHEQVALFRGPRRWLERIQRRPRRP